MRLGEELDKAMQDLEEKFPGWEFWYVPGSHRWRARPRPMLDAASPEQLAADITQAHTEAAAEWPALVGLDDYADMAPGIIRPPLL